MSFYNGLVIGIAFGAVVTLFAVFAVLKHLEGEGRVAESELEVWKDVNENGF